MKYQVQIKRLFFLFLAALSATALRAQVTVANDSTSKKLEILKANRYTFQKLDSVGNFVSVAGNVELRQDKTLFYCDSAVLDQVNNVFEAFGNIHINDADSIHTYSQYLKYYGKDKKAILRRKVKLTDGKGVLTTDELDYNTLTKIGTYVKGGKVVNGKTVLTSQEGYYYGDTRDVIFKKKVVLIDPEYRVVTDTLLYNTYTEISRFVVPTKITSGQRTVTTSEGYYDLKNKKAVFGKRPKIEDKDYTLIANDIAFDEASGYGEAQGNAVYNSKDTAGAYTIIANNMKSNNRTGAILATQKPLMIIKQGTDSIYVSADTLYSGKLTELQKTRQVPNIFVDTATVSDSSPAPDTTQEIGLVKRANNIKKADSTVAPKPARAKGDSSGNRFFEAYFNVKIFSDSMQAIGDSMFYSFQDSAFRLFKNPVVWAQGNQVTGDTIYLFTRNRKPDHFRVYENGLAVSKIDQQFYNQVKGNFINGYFNQGNINFMKAKGSAENIYYGVDDQGAFFGVNRSTSDVINIYFADRKPSRVVFINNLQGTVTPIKQSNPEEMKLRGFKWLEDRRPKSRSDLFGS
ncbi:hypothetical protein EXU57_09835 [Segetibacter sp. 3557_3]|uniref:OstA-like protein n=1 Tax=Segetibacter sp. 3557_3 TaxID=2547429 RepID=UPI001058BE13|nr:OstA-like protein [Segetibacter sp. 3557_3]TDH26391.1 hypothetical protein EXU57_09835 [Segetibacter sp. 3557_3]